MKFDEIVDKYDLDDNIAIPLKAELDEYFMAWWQKQASEWSKDNLRLTLRVEYLSKKLNGKY